MTDKPKKNLSDSQRASIFLLFIEYVSLPVLAMNIALLIAAIATYDASPSGMEFLTIFFAVMAIPLLSISIFIRKGAESLNPEVALKALPNRVEWGESFGVSFGVMTLLLYIGSVNLLLMVFFVFTALFALLLQVSFIKQQRQYDVNHKLGNNDSTESD